jgi:hypothetical protein
MKLIDFTLLSIYTPRHLLLEESVTIGYGYCWYHRVWGLIAIKGRVNSFGVFRDVLLARKVEELQVL